MPLEGGYVPDDEREMRLMEDLHIATRRAHADGISKQRIAALLAFMASASLDPQSDTEPAEDGAQRSVAEAMQEAVDDGGTVELGRCPECSAPVASYRAAMGGPVELPCGCEVSVEAAVAAGIMDDPEDS